MIKREREREQRMDSSTTKQVIEPGLGVQTGGEAGIKPDSWFSGLKTCMGSNNNILRASAHSIPTTLRKLRHRVMHSPEGLGQHPHASSLPPMFSAPAL